MRLTSAPRHSFPEPPPAVPATSIEKVDELIARLHSKKDEWVKSSISERIALLTKCQESVLEAAEGWVNAACKAKGLELGTAHAGEECLDCGQAA